MLKQLVQSTILSGFTRVVGLLVGLVSVAITSRVLGPEGRGYLAVVGSLVAMIATLGSLSLGQVVLNHAGERADDDAEWLSTSFGVLLTVTIIVSVIAALGMALAVTMGFARQVAGIPLAYLLLGLAALPLTIWTSYASYLLLARDLVRKSNLAQIAGAIGSLVAVAALVLWMRRGVSGALIATLIGLLINTLVGLHYLVRASKGRIRVRGALALRYLRDGAKLHLTSIGALLFSGLDILMVHHFRGPADAGLFQLAVQLYLPLLLFPQAVGEVLSSKLGVLGPRGLWQYQRRLILLSLGVMAAGAAVLAVAAPLVVRLLAGPEFAGAVPILRVYLLAVLGGTINTTMAVQWIGRGLFLQVSALTFGAGLANFLFNLVFIPRFGAQGAALATVVGVYLVPVSANLILAWRCEQEFRRGRGMAVVPTAEPA